MLRVLCASLVLGFGFVHPWTTDLVANNPEWSQSQAPGSAAAQGSSQASPVSAKSAEPSATPDLLDEANKFYRKGDFDRAIQRYQQLLQARPNSPDAYAGLTRVYLRKKDVQQAFDTVTRGLQLADSPVERVALGEVYFRQGRIPEAEREWLNVISSGHSDARAYLGLAGCAGPSACTRVAAI
jgi:tetratricopeptide (TPR) repeat protein